MSTFNTSVKYNITQEAVGNKLEMGYLYFKNVPVTYAKVHEPAKKLKLEDKAYQMNIYIDADTMAAVDELGVNKSFGEVNVAKITKGVNRNKLKFPVKDAEGNDTAHAPYAGLFCTQLTRDCVKRDKISNEIVKTYDPLKVVDTQGNPFTADVGNGSIVSVKVFCYRNAEGMLNTMMDTVVVIDHVEYIKAGGSDGYDEEFGFAIKSPAKAPAIDPELSDDVPVAKVVAKPKPAQKPAPVEHEIDFDDDIPF